MIKKISCLGLNLKQSIAIIAYSARFQKDYEQNPGQDVLLWTQTNH